MEGQSAAPGPNRTAAVAIIVAVLALGAFVVVGIGVLLGWIPRGDASDRSPATAKASAPAGKASRFGPVTKPIRKLISCQPQMMSAAVKAR